MSDIRNEKMLANLHRKIAESGANTQEEINAVVQELLAVQNGGDADNADEYEMSDEEKSQDLVYEANDAKYFEDAKRLINKALKLNPNNVDAILFVAEKETNPSKVLPIYQKAVKAGRDNLGADFFQENEGHFWGILETRPFMRAMLRLGGEYYVKKMCGKALDIYAEMLELCPNDNMGVRYLYATLLLEEGLLDELEEFYDSVEEEDNVNYNYSIALLQFKKEGASANSNKLLLKAFNQNSAVVSYLLKEKEVGFPLPDSIVHGSNDEAKVYAVYNLNAWIKSPKALDWIVNFREERRIVN